MSVDMSLIHASVRKTRNTALLVAFITIAMGGGMVAAAVAGASHGVAAGIIGGLFLLLGAWMVRWAASLWNPARAPVTRLIAERPRDIQWIYVEQINSTLAGQTVKKTHSVKVVDERDKTHTLMVANRNLDAVVSGLRAVAPDALHGYDPATIAEHKARVARRRAA